MGDIVASFNRLNRPERILVGTVRNHWYFTIRHMPFYPAGDRVQITNTESRWHISTDQKQILSLPTLAARVDIIVPLILETFVKGVHRLPDGRPNPSLPTYAPFSWGTKSPELARAVEKKLRALCVRADLCTVMPGIKEQNDIADESWMQFMNSMVNMGMALPEQASPGRVICGGCKKDSSWFSDGLMKCSKCNTKSYCSRGCQRGDWKEHKKVCGESNDQQSSSSAAQPMDPSEYYHKVAHTVQEAKILADSISLPLPPRGGSLS